MNNNISENEKLAKKICSFLKDEFGKRGMTSAVIGLSSGIDSTVCAYLCKRAGLDVYGILLPYKGGDLEKSQKVADSLELENDKIITVDIAAAVDAQFNQLNEIMPLDEVDKGNMMARQRMIVQYAIARRVKGLVVGTENLSEYYLGYFTLHGDQACDISPISSLLKTEVRSLAKHLGVPDWVIEKQPSAGLWPGQTDENELGFSYEEADPILTNAVIKKYSVERLKQDINPELIDKVLARVEATNFKRGTAPRI